MVSRARLIDSPFWDSVSASDKARPEVANLTLGSGRKVNWICAYGHPHTIAVYSKVSRAATKDKGCAVCANRVIMKQINDLATTHPHLAAQWHPTLNEKVSPDEVTAGSTAKIWWHDATCGHSWQAQVRARVLGTNCSICAGKKVDAKTTSLQAKRPEIAEQWHPTHNKLQPDEVAMSSNKAVWWLCENGHEWSAPPNRRTGKLASGCPVCAGNQVLVGYNDLQTTDPDLAVQLDATASGFTAEEVTRGAERQAVWRCESGHAWRTSVFNRIRHFRDNGYSACPVCINHYSSSKGEEEIADFLRPLIKIEQSARKYLGGGYEIDIYVPELNIGIEFNGIFWHSERMKSKQYHEEKWALARSKGIQLIQVWEDEWYQRPETMKRVLLHKLGLSADKVVYARVTVLDEIDHVEARGFFEANHIQGFASGSHYLGLKSRGGELVACMVLKREKEQTLAIIRYATAARVPGGFTKLMKAAEYMYHPKRFLTFSDHAISDGSLYATNGFIEDKELKPDYMYVVGMERKHKFGYRLERFKSDPALKYEPGLTERKLAELNGLLRVWDAGKTRWVRMVA